MKLLKEFLIGVLKGTLELIPVIILIWVITIMLNWAHAIGIFITKITFLHKLLPNHEIIDSVLSIILFLIFAYFFGKLTSKGLGAFMHRKVDSLLRKFPMIGKVYKTAKDMVNLFKENKEQHKPNIIALVKFDDNYSLGFIIYNKNLHNGDLAPVFMPDPPIPTSGALNLMEKNRILVLDTTWEDAVTYILSLGGSVTESMVRNLEDIKKLPSLTEYLENIK